MAADPSPPNCVRHHRRSSGPSNMCSASRPSSDETHTFTPRLLNDFRLGYTRRGNNICRADAWHTPHPAAARHPRHPDQRGVQITRCRCSPSPATSNWGRRPAPSRSTRPPCGSSSTRSATPAASRHQGRHRLPLVPAQHRLAAEPDGLLRFHHHRHRHADRRLDRDRRAGTPWPASCSARSTPSPSTCRPRRSARAITSSGVLRSGRLARHRQASRSTSAPAIPCTSLRPKRTTRAPSSTSATQQLDYARCRSGNSQERPRTALR